MAPRATSGDLPRHDLPIRHRHGLTSCSPYIPPRFRSISAGAVRVTRLQSVRAMRDPCGGGSRGSGLVGAQVGYPGWGGAPRVAGTVASEGRRVAGDHGGISVVPGRYLGDRRFGSGGSVPGEDELGNQVGYVDPGGAADGLCPVDEDHRPGAVNQQVRLVDVAVQSYTSSERQYGP